MSRGSRYANVTSTMALVVALGGTGAYAANTIGSADIRNNSIRSVDIKAKEVKGTDLAGNAVTGAKVKAGSLEASDFKAGQVPAGPRGAVGAPGAKGDKGDPGTPATRLFASTNAACTAVEPNSGSGVVGVNLNFASRCDVRFGRDVRNCTAVATTREVIAGGEVLVAKGDDPPAELDDDEIGIIFRNSAGALSSPTKVELAVFCP